MLTAPSQNTLLVVTGEGVFYNVVSVVVIFGKRIKSFVVRTHRNGFGIDIFTEYSYNIAFKIVHTYRLNGSISPEVISLSLFSASRASIPQ